MDDLIDNTVAYINNNTFYLNEQDDVDITCYACKKNLLRGYVNLPMMQKDRVLILQNTPCYVCKDCGLYQMESEMVDETTRIFEQFYLTDSNLAIWTHTYVEDSIKIYTQKPFLVPEYQGYRFPNKMHSMLG